MLPKLYTLETVQVVGHLRHSFPDIYCPQCGREIDHYQGLELALDSWPECDLVAAPAGTYFASERLLRELAQIGAKGYAQQPITLSLSDDFRRSYPGAIEMPNEIPRFHYFVITGRCDGPWIRHAKGKACAACGQPLPILTQDIDFDSLLATAMGDVPPNVTLVFPETWHGEDFFYLSEPGPPLVTERIIMIMTEMGNLRKEQIMNKDVVRRLMPEYAAELEKRNWEISKCIVLGPADWVTKY